MNCYIFVMLAFSMSPFIDLFYLGFLSVTFYKFRECSNEISASSPTSSTEIINSINLMGYVQVKIIGKTQLYICFVEAIASEPFMGHGAHLMKWSHMLTWTIQWRMSFRKIMHKFESTIFNHPLECDFSPWGLSY